MSFELYLSPPHLSGREEHYMNEAIRTNWVAPLGPNVEAFENEMAKYLGEGVGCLALSSGTAAIHLALRLCGVTAGDTVLASSLTFIGTVNPVLYEGAIPVFVDSEPGSWNLCIESLEKAISELSRKGIKPKALIAVNLYGQSADYAKIEDICAREKIALIEDAAESLGATYGKRKCGTFGRFGILSFNGNKIITTSGGGMLVSRDLEALKKARFLATQARDPAPWYEHTEMGFNYRLSNVLAGIGRGQLEVLEDRVASRRRIFDRYAKGFSGVPEIQMMPEAAFGRTNRWLTVVSLDSTKTTVKPLEIIQVLASKKIEARPVWKPMHRQPIFLKSDFYSIRTKKSFSDEAFETGLCLPSGSAMSDDQVDRVVGIVREFLKGRAS